MHSRTLVVLPVIVGLLLGVATTPAEAVACDAAALGEAVTAANADPDRTTIELAAGCTYELAEPLPEVTAPLVIEGNGATVTRAADAPAFRFLLAQEAPDLTVRDTAFVGGDAGNELGGAITTETTADIGSSPQIQQGSITLERVEVRDSSAARGGALHSGPSIALTIVDSTFEGNSATYGGAVSVLGSTVTIDRTTFVANSSTSRDTGGPPGLGGALLSVDFRGMPAIVTVTNSTFSDNESPGAVVQVLSGNPFGNGWEQFSTAHERRVALEDDGEEAAEGTELRLVHSTVTASATGVGMDPGEGGLPPAAVSGSEFITPRQEPSSTPPLLVHLRSTIVADQTAGTDCGEGVRSAGTNLDSDGSCPLDQDGDVPNGAAELQPLTLQPGALTRTHPLGVGSDALDAAGTGTCAASEVAQDQTGRERPLGPGCDIGADESPQGSVVLRLDTDPADRPAAGEEPISFAISPALGSVDAVPLRDGDEFRADEQPAGTYEVAPDLPPGWLASAVECTDPSEDSTTDVAAATATLEVGFEEVACVFTLVPPTPPTVEAGGPYETETGAPVELDGTATPGTGDVTTLLWTTETDGCSLTDADEAAATLTCRTAGTAAVRLTVTDEFGLTASDDAVVEVTAAAAAGEGQPDDDDGDTAAEDGAAAPDGDDPLPETGGAAALFGVALLAAASRVGRRD